MPTKTSNQSVRLSKTVVVNAPIPNRGQTFIRDADLQCFALRITASGTKTYIVEKRIDGRNRRITIGKHGELTAVQARKKAQSVLGQIAMGMDPVAERKRRTRQAVTLKAAFDEFKKGRKHLSDKTLYDYDRVLRVALKDWLAKPVTRITPDMVQKRFQKITRDRGEAYANLTMRTLRAILNYANEVYDDGTGEGLFVRNPVSVLTRTRQWHKPKRRQTVIKLHEMKSWSEALETLRDSDDPFSFGDTIADYHLLLIFTGLRRGEAASLTWPDIDLDDRTFFLRKTKNGEAITLPMSESVWELFKRRQQNVFSNYVFPGRTERRPLVEPKKQIAKVIKASGVNYTLHDLRRTFITVAESLDIPPYAIKRLANHKMNNDVTAGYIVSDIERLRRPAQKVDDFLCDAFEGKARDIVPFPESARKRFPVIDGGKATGASKKRSDR